MKEEEHSQSTLMSSEQNNFVLSVINTIDSVERGTGRIKHWSDSLHLSCSGCASQAEDAKQHKRVRAFFERSYSFMSYNNAIMQS
jgi:hypothetical protein